MQQQQQLIPHESSLHVDLDDTFRKDGLLSRYFASYAPRMQQIEMILKIAEAIVKSAKTGVPFHAIVEAGTGTGKSMGLSFPISYAVARTKQAIAKDERPPRALIVTATTTLQGQFYDEFSLINKVLKEKGLNVKVALYKGKNNYICTNRFLRFLDSKKLTDAEKVELNEILPELSNKDNTLNLEKCDKQKLPKQPSDALWEKININLDSSCADCEYRKNGCYYHLIRDEGQDADIFVGNHAMLMQDLKMRLKTGKGTLPEYDYVVIDEAHHVEMGLAEDFSSKIELTAMFGISKTIEWMLKNFDLKDAKIALIESYHTKFKREVLKIFDFFKKQCNGKSIPWSHKVVPSGIELESVTEKLLIEIAKILMNTTKQAERNRLNSLSNRILALVKDLKAFAFNEADSDYFFNIKYDRNTDQISLLMTPLNGGELMNKVLFSRVPVIIASATIKLGENLDVFARKIGNLKPTEFTQLCVPSPFDYKKNSMFYIPANALGAKEDGYDKYCQDEMKRLVDLSRGRAFLLFTSKTTLDSYYKVLAPYFKQKGYDCFKQGDADRLTLIEQFKKSKNGVLFGGDSFWEGVDIPGRTLCNVIMQKLPFNTPDPISQAKEALVSAAGRDAFEECQVFPAIIKFKQGVGRLIRKTTDGGIITLLDGRVFIKKNFGKYFIHALPDGMGKTVNFSDLAPFVEE